MRWWRKPAGGPFPRQLCRSRRLPGHDSCTSGVWDTELSPVHPREGAAGRTQGGAGEDAVSSMRTCGRGGSPGEEAGVGSTSFNTRDWSPPRGQERGSASTVITVTGICRDVLNSHYEWPRSLVVGCISHMASGKLLNLFQPQFPLFLKNR